MPQILSIAALGEVLAVAKPGSTQWWQPAFPSVVVLQQALYWYLREYTSVGGLSTIRYGYLTLSRQILQEVIDRALPALRPDLERWFPASAPADASQVLAALESLPVTLWPNEPGPVLHEAGDNVLIDVAAASRHLLRMCTVTAAGGALPNARADRFEADVRTLLDTSPWKPGPALTHGMKPKPDANGPVTDLDAVGEYEGTLLIVSCKSVPYSARYDAGDFRSVNNVIRTVDAAITKWDSVVQTFTDTPIGRNYDLSRFQRVIGIVCLPHIPYTPLGPATEPVLTAPGGSTLRKVCSYTELRRWLQDHN
ncbi:hypothetical protein [Kitasatospora sp. NPDC059327]|uniref:hypothetical protein n=1 Tax=Kitasatospora sp. NPDC059327 TaxID=3346803 RepID=UPI0036C90277